MQSEDGCLLKPYLDRNLGVHKYRPFKDTNFDAASSISTTEARYSGDLTNHSASDCTSYVSQCGTCIKVLLEEESGASAYHKT